MPFWYFTHYSTPFSLERFSLRGNSHYFLSPLWSSIYMHPPFLCDNWAIINSCLLFCQVRSTPIVYFQYPAIFLPLGYCITSAIYFKNRKAPADTLPSGGCAFRSLTHADDCHQQDPGCASIYQSSISAAIKTKRL